MFLDRLFCPTNSPDLKRIEFIVTLGKILSFEKLELANVWHICLINTVRLLKLLLILLIR